MNCSASFLSLNYLDQGLSPLKTARNDQNRLQQVGYHPVICELAHGETFSKESKVKVKK